MSADLHVCRTDAGRACRTDAGLRPRGPSPRLSGQAYLDANLEAPRPSENATSIWNAISIWIVTETLRGEMLPAGPLPTGTLPVGTLPTGTLPTGTLPGPSLRLRPFGWAEDMTERRKLLQWSKSALQ